MPLAQGTQIMGVLKKYIRVKETGDARLGFEALRLLASLFCHKKYTLEWVYTGKIQRGGGGLLRYCKNDIKKICLLRKSDQGLEQERKAKYLKLFVNSPGTH